MCARVYVCVRACARASVWTPSLYKAYGPQHSPTSGALCNKRERGRRLQRRDMTKAMRQAFTQWKSHSALLYASFRTENAGLLVCCGCWWVIFSQCFEGTYHLHLQGNGSVNSPITLKMKAVRFFETSGRNYPTPGGQPLRRFGS